MTTDPLTLATERIRDLIRKGRSSLEATFQVTELMTAQDAAAVLDRLMVQRYLCQMDADLAQMLAAKLGREVRWRHTQFAKDGEWKEGRGA